MEEPVPNSSINSSNDNLQKKPMVWFVALGVIAVFILGYALLKTDLISQFKGFSQAGLNGKIYLSLVPIPKESNPISIYVLDLPSKSINNFITASDEAKEEYLTLKFSKDGQKTVFASIGYDGSSQKIYVGDSSGKITGGVPFDRDSGVVRNPVFNSNGSKVAYLEKNDFKGGELDPSLWSVIVFDFDSGKEIEITDGVNPIFIADGRLLVLRKDGLYLYKFYPDDSGISFEIQGKKIWKAVGGNAYANMHLNVSPDESMIVWSDPLDKKVYVSKVNSWDNFDYNSVATIHSHAFWPVFSPDSKYLALQEVDWTSPPSNPRLVIYDLKDTNKNVFSFDLSNFYQEAMFITDWR